MTEAMTDEQRMIAATKRYHAAAHAVQSGVAMDMVQGTSSVEPKHLRTGIDTAKAEQEGLARLLIAKGVITEVEYFEAMAAGVEDEKARYEARLEECLGRKVSLG